jgi:hypothetical protein
MPRFQPFTLRGALVASAAAALLTCGPALARNDEPPGQAKKHGHSQADKHGHGDRDAQHGKGGRAEVRVGAYFNDAQRDAARRYYVQQYPQAGRCPPGLAKKNNGCLPPGQARKYALGQPLPRDVVYYPVPRGVLLQLPPVPIGHEYVRVAGDVLLIAVGTHMVVDAITDLMRM